MLRRLISLCIFFALNLAALEGAGSQTRGPTEYDVKAAYIYNFAKFVQWPQARFDSGSDSIVVGILGDDPIGQTLKVTLSGKSANGRGFCVRRLDDITQSGACHILYVSESLRGSLGNRLRNLAELGILTVGDWKGFAKDDGVIGFILVDDKVKFQVRLDLAKAGGIDISSRLLRVGEVVGS